jgi:hypoxanthine phosphoribosyltransferase
MKVLTLNHNAFAAECRKLADMASRLGSYDCVVGIATGGVYVAQEMTLAMNLPMFSVVQQRPSTRRKRGVMKRIVNSSPRWFNDLLRQSEALLLSISHKPSAVNLHRVEIPADLSSFLSAGKNRHVLLVDDAVDSGSTMASVEAALKHCPTVESVTKAAIVVTRKSALPMADCHLHSGKYLIRFPWSIDYKPDYDNAD